MSEYFEVADSVFEYGDGRSSGLVYVGFPSLTALYREDYSCCSKTHEQAYGHVLVFYSRDLVRW